MNKPLVYIIVGMFVVIGLYRYGFHKGWKERDSEMQVVIAQKNEEARQKEQDMAKTMTGKDAELRKANDDVSKKQTDLNRLIAAGRVRLPAPSCVQASQNPATAPGDRDAQESESERKTLELIAAIAADGDKAINQLNACISAYNEIMERVNADR